MCPQNVTSEGYKQKTFLLAPLAALFYIPILKMAPPPTIVVAVVSSVRLVTIPP